MKEEKNVQPNRLLIFHGPTIYGAVSTSNLLLSKAEQGNGGRGQKNIGDECERNAKQISVV